MELRCQAAVSRFSRLLNLKGEKIEGELYAFAISRKLSVSCTVASCMYGTCMRALWYRDMPKLAAN